MILHLKSSSASELRLEYFARLWKISWQNTELPLNANEQDNLLTFNKKRAVKALFFYTYFGVHSVTTFVFELIINPTRLDF